MTRPAAGAVATIVSVALGAGGLAACGGGDDDTTPATGASGATGPTGALAACAADFNDSARDTFPRLARLAHKRGNELTVGTYDRAQFSAQTFDEGIGGGKVTVAPGACVVTEVTGALGPLYLFVVGDDGEWHSVSVTDPAVPLARDPERQLSDAQTVELSDVAPPQVPTLVPAS